MAIRCTVFLLGKNIDYFKNSNISTTVREKKHNGFENNSEVFYLLKRLKKIYTAPKVYINHWEKITIIALQRNSYWESIRLVWASIDFSLFSAKVFPFTD